MLKKRGITFKLTFYILSSCAVVFVLILGYDYLVSRNYISTTVDKEAHYRTEITVHKIETVLQSVEEAPETLSYFLENATYSEADLKRVLKAVVKNNPRIFGAAVAFEPHLFRKDLYYFAPYYYDGEQGVLYKSLGNKEYNYFEKDWYKNAKEKGEPGWSEPYHDQVTGKKVVMATYAVPFYKIVGEENVFAGVVTADVSLSWIQELISSIRVEGKGHGFIISNKGEFITHPDIDIVLDKTIFDLARDHENERLHEIAKDMAAGKSHQTQYQSVVTNDDSWLIYTPIPSSKWALGIDFPKDAILADLIYLDETVLALVLIGIALLFVVIFSVARKMTKSLRTLDEKTKEIAAGNLEFEPPEIKSDDEIGRLATSFVSMRNSLRHYIDELTKATAAKEKILSELRIARDIQMSIVPKVSPPFSDSAHFDISAILKPAKEVGGDFYDFFFVGEDKLCFVVGDVSGKGVPAALFMAVVKTLIKSLAKTGLPPDEILRIANKEACYNNSSSMFVTVFFAILDLKSGELSFVSGGHNPPVIVRKAEDTILLKTIYGTAVGALETSRFQSERVTMKPGDAICLYTDGVTEAFDRKGAMFSEERLVQVVEKNRDKKARGIVDSLLSSVDSFSSGTEPSDDITILCVRYL